MQAGIVSAWPVRLIEVAPFDYVVAQNDSSEDRPASLLAVGRADQENGLAVSWPIAPLAGQAVNCWTEPIDRDRVIAAGRLIAAPRLKCGYEILQILAVDEELDPDPSTTVVICPWAESNFESVHREEHRPRK